MNWYSPFLFCVSKSVLGLEAEGQSTRLWSNVTVFPTAAIPRYPILQLSHLFRPRLRRSWIEHCASLLNDTDRGFPTTGCSRWLAFTGTTGLGSRLDQHPWLVEFILGWCSNYWRCLESETRDVQHVDAMLQNVDALAAWRALWCT